jgi:hypothetical protein
MTSPRPRTLRWINGPWMTYPGPSHIDAYTMQGSVPIPTAGRYQLRATSIVGQWTAWRHFDVLMVSAKSVAKTPLLQSPGSGEGPQQLAVVPGGLNPVLDKAGQDLKGLADRLQKLGASQEGSRLLGEVRALQRRLGDPGGDLPTLLANLKKLQDQTDKLELSLHRLPSPSRPGGSPAPR